jgi:hypothetical protein
VRGFVTNLLSVAHGEFPAPSGPLQLGDIQINARAEVVDDASH